MQPRPASHGADTKPKPSVFPACPWMPEEAKVLEFHTCTGIGQTSEFSGSPTMLIFIGSASFQSTGSYLLQQWIIPQNIIASKTQMTDLQNVSIPESSRRSAETLADHLSQAARTRAGVLPHSVSPALRPPGDPPPPSLQ